METINTRASFGRQYYDELRKIAQGAADDNTQNYFRKSLTFDTASGGSEFIPTKYSAEIITNVFEIAWPRQLFGTWVFDNLTERIPKFTNAGAVYYQAASITSLDQAQQLSESATPDTTYVEATLKTLFINHMVDNKFLAYNASPQIEALLKEELAQAIAEKEGVAILDGDTTATHMDSDVTVATDPKKAFQGLRKTALATSGKSFASAGADPVQADFRKALYKLGRHGRGNSVGGARNDVAFIIGAYTESYVLGFPELTTLEKYGPQATVITGEIGKLWGASVVVTDGVRENLNAAGVYDGVTTDRTYFLAVNRKQFLIGVPRNTDRALKLTVKDEPEFDRKRMIFIEDITLVRRYDEAVAICYGITVVSS